MAFFSNFALMTEPNRTVTLEFFYKTSYYQIKEEIQIKTLHCLRGDIFINNRCIRCKNMFYSLEYSPYEAWLRGSSYCKFCPANAECYGDKIIPNYGFFRLNENTSIVNYACPYQKYVKNQSLSNYSFVFICGKGYVGPLCETCDSKYGKTGKQCVLCENNKKFYLIFFLSICLLLAFILYQKVSIVGMSAGLERALIKILVNHFSFISIIGVFELDYQAIIKDFFHFSENYSTNPKGAFSFDCFLANKFSYNEIFEKNLIILCIFPIICSVALQIFEQFLMFFYVLFTKKKKLLELVKRIFSLKLILFNFTSFLVIVMYNFYPTIVLKLMSLFKCLQITETEWYFYENPIIKCYSIQHKKYLAIGIPFLIIWGLGLPIIIFLISTKRKRINSILNKEEENLEINFTNKKSQNSNEFFTSKNEGNFQNNNKNNNNNNIIDETIIIKREIKNTKIALINYFINDYKNKYSYWEFVIFLRKLIVITIIVMSSFFDSISVGGLSIFIFSIFLFLNIILKPFKNKLACNLETNSLSLSIITIAFALLASRNELLASVRLFFLTLLLILNILFFSVWLYHYILILYKKGKEGFYQLTKLISDFKGRISRISKYSQETPAYVSKEYDKNYNRIFSTNGINLRIKLQNIIDYYEIKVKSRNNEEQLQKFN